MHTSDSGKDLIKQFEALRLRAYLDAVGVWTIGWGHTRGVKKDDVITREIAQQLFEEDLLEVEAAIQKHVTTTISQQQFDALASFVFNFGETKFATSTLLRKINARDFEGAALEFRKWVYGTDPVTKEKVKLNGLIRRRSAEEVMFRAGTDAGGLQQTAAGAVDAGGKIPPAEQPPAPVEDRILPPYTPERTRKERAMPAPLVVPILSSLVPVLVPKLVELLPELTKIFGDRERNSTDQYISAGVKVLETITQATGARNAQEAVEKVAQDAEAREVARSAVKAIWFDLQVVEFGGGPVAAREFALIGAPHYADVLKNVTYGALGFLALANAGVFASVIVAVTTASEHAQALMNLGSMVVQADIGAALMAFGFWLGSSVAKTRVEDGK